MNITNINKSPLRLSTIFRNETSTLRAADAKPLACHTVGVNQAIVIINNDTVHGISG